MIASNNEKLILYLMKQLYLERLNLCEILWCSIRNAISHGSTRSRKMAHLSPSQLFWIESQLLQSGTHDAL